MPPPPGMRHHHQHKHLPPVRETRVLETDLGAVLGAFALVVIGFWIRHGGIGAFTKGWVDVATSIAQITGLLASAFGLLGLALVGRPRSVERRYGLDRMFIWHRILGESMAVLVGAHIAASIVAWSADGGVFNAVRDLTGRQPYMAIATVGALLIGVVTVSSLASIRRRMSYETWYFLHLAAYAGFALSFSHQIVMGGIFATDSLARWVWILAHAAVLLLLIVRRWGTTLRSVLNPLRVAEAKQVSPDAVSLRLSGRGLKNLEASPGQFFFLRPLKGRLWWQTHPFSLSAAPSTNGLRFTIKTRGDGTNAITSLPIGTAVAVEGPYGITTPEVVGAGKVLFVAGGVGVAHTRALLEGLGPRSEPIVLFRANTAEDLIHLDEVRELVEARGGTVRTLVGPSAKLAVKDPFSAQRLKAAVPDLKQRTAVLCGPERLVWAARAGLLAAGVDSSRIHYERPWW